jgi:hypothetical protein
LADGGAPTFIVRALDLPTNHRYNSTKDQMTARIVRKDYLPNTVVQTVIIEYNPLKDVDDSIRDRQLAHILGTMDQIKMWVKDGNSK